MASLHWSFVNRSCALLTSFNLAHAQKTSEGDLRLENKLVPILNLGLSFGSPSNKKFDGRLFYFLREVRVAN